MNLQAEKRKGPYNEHEIHLGHLAVLYPVLLVHISHPGL